MKQPMQNRILSFLLALVLFVSYLPLPALSVGSEEPNGSNGNNVGSPNSSELIYDYDTLKITREGKPINFLTIYEYEKVQIQADGLEEAAKYQWQVQHPEKDDVWVNIYDGTNQDISVTLALVENVLRDNGSAKLRCRAYTDTYAYLSNSVTVTVLPKELAGTTSTVPKLQRNEPVMPAADDPATPEFVTITINYDQYRKVSNDPADEQFQLEKEDVFFPYIATLTYGAPRPDGVSCPDLVGYEPLIANVTVGGVQNLGAATLVDGKIEVTAGTITADIEITVHYRPKSVLYQVRYFFQNVYDDLYVENDTLLQPITDGAGFTGTTPVLKQKDVPGFTCLFYEPDTIAADGSTVFYVYYERNYYLMEFDCDGGYGADTLYVRYGTNVVVPNPVKSGYAFAGWDLISAKDENGDPLDVKTESDQLLPWVDGKDDVSAKVDFNDKHVDDLPVALPYFNTAYKAMWTQANTTFSYAYWIRDPEGNNRYVGSFVQEGVSGNYIDGSDNLGEKDINGNLLRPMCGFEVHGHEDSCFTCNDVDHAHVTACYVCNQDVHVHDPEYCQIDCDHEHDLTCYPYISKGGELTSSSNKNDWDAVQGANNNIEPDGVYLYVISTTSDSRNWPKIYVDGHYYDAFVIGNNPISNELLTGIVDKQVSTYTTTAGYTARKYKLKHYCEHHNAGCVDCDITTHAHVAGCHLCGKEAHTHTPACYERTEYLEYIESDQHVMIEGDGSTVVNVYYQYREYTLKFYYAASTGTGDNIEYKIVGGSTYLFGQDGTDTLDDATLLHNMYQETGRWGAVDELPRLNQKGSDCNYSTGTLVHGDVTYYYVSFSARFGDDISEKWPCGVFESVTRKNTNNASGWKGTEAFVSAWNGEHRVAYSQNNSNETIKGIYERLDDQLVFHTKFTDADTRNATEISFLCFWENGSPTVDWSVPELYRYNIWLEGRATNGEPEMIRNGVYYHCASSYDTCDNSDAGEQTQPALQGYTPVTFPDYTDVRYWYDVVQDSNPQKYFEYRPLIKDETGDHADDPAYYDGTLYREGYEVNFYYNCIDHKLVFWNHSDYLTNGSGVLLHFGDSLQKYGAYVNSDYMKNHYPSNLESGAYRFAGWYLSHTFAAGTEVQWDTMTMPNNNLKVYAKWETVERNVRFYLTYDVMDEYLALTDAQKAEAKYDYFWWPSGIDNPYPITIAHGKALGTEFSYIPERYIDKNGNGQIDQDETEKYAFVGWFYIDENGKKRFAPDTMEVKRDLDLFAEWRAEMDTSYTIHYVRKDSDTDPANNVVIADPTEGHMSVGHTKTFEAKTGSQLYPAFQTMGLFPTTSSHSILMEPNPADNTFTFEYVQEDGVWYEVKYINKVTGVELGSKPKEKSTNAIVTEKYKAFAGFTPESYYITRVLTSDGEATEPIAENIIVFYYVPATTTALYTVQFYQEKVDSTDSSKEENYDLVQTEVLSGKIGSTMNYAVIADRFAGFSYAFSTVTTYQQNGNTFDSTTSSHLTEPEPSGQLSAGGLEFKIYYSRNPFGYTIKFVEWGTGKTLGYGKLGKDGVVQDVQDETLYKLGSKKDFTAPDVINKGGIEYDFYEVLDKTQTQSLTVQADKALNVLTFYYKTKEVTIYYLAICLTPGAKDQDYGRVSHNVEYLTTSEVTGSTAMPSAGFKFVGWYTTPECKIEDKIGDNAYLRPVYPDEDVKYFALFEPIVSTLTIEKTVQNLPAGMKNDDVFLFHIQGVGKTSYIDIVVSIHGSGSVVLQNLPVGDYIITELTDWSWKYTAADSSRTIEVTEADGQKVSFTNNYADPDWLGGEGSQDNKFSNP